MALKPSWAAVLAVCLCAQLSTAFILSVDLGSQFFKAAIVKPGKPFEIVHNTHSKRKTPTTVSFHEKVRTFGDDAVMSASRGIRKTPMFFPLQLGRDTTAEAADSLPWLPKLFYPYELEAHPSGGLAFRFGDDVVMPTEEATAHVLTFAKSIAEDAADGAKASETILTVPASANYVQRRALLAAAEIAGLPRASLIHETSASALQRALDLDFSGNDTANESMVLFYNMGARHVEVCVVNYRGATHLSKPTVAMDVLGCADNKVLGGHQVDLVIADKMLQAFKSKFPKLTDIESSVRALRKLEKEANAAKHLLSANKEGAFRVESLYEDTDFKEPINRETLEAWSAELFATMGNPVEAALKAANVSFEALDAIEMVGGGWRIPRVQSWLSEFFVERRPNLPVLNLSQHVNGEEGMAQGAAFFGANNSVSFRVKKIFFTDTSPHEYSLSLEPLNKSQPHEEGWSRQVDLYLAKQTLKARKTVKLHQPFDVKATLLENGKPVVHWIIDGVYQAATEKYPHLSSPLVTFKLELDSSGVVVVESATAIFDEPVEEKVAAANYSGENATTNNTGGNATTNITGEAEADDKRPSEGDAEQGSSGESDKDAGSGGETESNTSDANGTDSNASAMESDVDTEAKDKKPKVKKVKVPLKVEESFEGIVPRPLSPEEKAASIERLQASNAADDEVRKMEATKNALESFIYENRDKLGSDENCMTVSKEADREEIIGKMGEVEEWLYDDGSMANTAAPFDDKLKGLQDLVYPILRRAHEYEQRPQLPEIVEKVRDYVSATLIYVEKNMTWVSEKEREGVMNLTASFNEWYANVTEQQQALDVTAEPAYSTVDAKRRLQKIQSEAQRLTKIQKIEYDYSKYGDSSGKYGGHGKYDDPRMRKMYEEMFKNFSAANNTSWRDRNFSGHNDTDYMRSFYDYYAKSYGKTEDSNNSETGNMDGKPDEAESGKYETDADEHDGPQGEEKQESDEKSESTEQAEAQAEEGKSKKSEL